MAKICSRDFRDAVIVERPTETTDGAGGFTVAWATVATVFCMIETSGGNERLEAGRLEPESSIVATCHYRGDLLESDRLNIGGSYYNVTRLENVDRRERFLKIYAETGVRT